MAQDINRKREYQRDWIRAKRERQKEAKEQKDSTFFNELSNACQWFPSLDHAVIISDLTEILRDTIEDIRTDSTIRKAEQGRVISQLATVVLKCVETDMRVVIEADILERIENLESAVNNQNVRTVWV
jgi:hypothetical protein